MTRRHQYRFVQALAVVAVATIAASYGPIGIVAVAVAVGAGTRHGRRLLRLGWGDLIRRRTRRTARRQFRLARRTRRRIANGHYQTAEPATVQQALWWALWAMSREISPVRFAELMANTNRDWADATGYLAAQVYTIPTRHPSEVDAAVWALEVRALHDAARALPSIEGGAGRGVA